VIRSAIGQVLAGLNVADVEWTTEKDAELKLRAAKYRG
jgi:hypothetical protein